MSAISDAVLTAWDNADAQLAVYHAAGIGSTWIREIAEIVVAAVGRPDIRISYTGGDRGWPGMCQISL
jgi:nucleoside-diphosphate-sugar epimerase